MVTGGFDSPSSAYGILMYFEQVVTTTGRLPVCMESDPIDCIGCPFELEATCPLRDDPGVRSLLLTYRDEYVAYQRQRTRRIELLKRTLTAYKLPIHWQNLATLVMHRYPQLFGSSGEIKGLVYFNPDVFEVDKNGIVKLA